MHDAVLTVAARSGNVVGRSWQSLFLAEKSDAASAAPSMLALSLQPARFIRDSPSDTCSATDRIEQLNIYRDGLKVVCFRDSELDHILWLSLINH